MNRILELVVGMGWAQWNRFRIARGWMEPGDGWRRAAGIALRGEESTFVLSSFGLKGDSASVLAVLRHVLDQERTCRGRLIRDLHHDYRIEHPQAKFMFREDPWQDGHRRFLAPHEWEGSSNAASGATDTHDGPPTFKFVFRDSKRGEVDVWCQVNHVMLDGVPAQAILNELNRCLEKCSVLFPTYDEFSSVDSLRQVKGRAAFVELQTFVDMSRLNHWRRTQRSLIGAEMTLTAAILWWLARRAPWQGLYMGTTVDVPAPGREPLGQQLTEPRTSRRSNIQRGVGILVIRPSDYSPTRDGLAKYVRDFNREMERIRKRSNGSAKLLDAAATIPAKLERTLLRKALETPRAFGAMGVTMLRDASVFGAPISIAGHDYGFLAVGNIALPTREGGEVACICIKGKMGIVDRYPQLLQDALYDAVPH